MSLSVSVVPSGAGAHVQEQLLGQGGGCLQERLVRIVAVNKDGVGVLVQVDLHQPVLAHSPTTSPRPYRG